MARLIPKERIWPAIIIGALAANVVFGIVLARVANRGSSLAVEPDYYTKAVQWDSAVAEARRSSALGWHVSPALTAVGDEQGAVLSLAMRDAAGAPIIGAVVRVEARQVAHADENLVATLVADDPGAYRAALPMVRAGLWEVRVDATRGAEHFTTMLRLDASRSGAGVVVTERPGDPIPERVTAGTRPGRGVQ